MRTGQEHAVLRALLRRGEHLRGYAMLTQHARGLPPPSAGRVPALRGMPVLSAPLLQRNQALVKCQTTWVRGMCVLRAQARDLRRAAQRRCLQPVLAHAVA